MNLEELSKSKHASNSILELVDELIEKLSVNDHIILEQKISVEATRRLTNETTTVLRHVINEINGNDTAELKISKVSEIVSSLISSLESSMKMSSDDLIRLEATQDGMRRALEVVRSTGRTRMQELEKIEQSKTREKTFDIVEINDHPEASSSSSIASRSKKKIINEERST